ncbi:3000_t:CDS:2 [Entrophospora sp. SA101]|nr:3000_t:CDS:2 [Entrophospora sp. SA101]
MFYTAQFRNYSIPPFLLNRIAITEQKKLIIRCGIWSSYDPYVPKEGAAGGPPSKTVEIQKKIDDTVEVIRDNLKFVAGRGEKLDNLQDKTGNLCWKKICQNRQKDFIFSQMKYEKKRGGKI